MISKDEAKDEAMALKDNAEVIRKWLDVHEWRFDERTFAGERVVFKTSIAAESNIFKGYDISIICRENDVQSLFYPPIKATPKHFAPVAEYLMRLNYRFRIGKWTLDYADGEIRFEVVKDGKMLESDAEEAIDDLILFPEYVCDGFAEGIVQIITGAKTPELAYAEADARDDMPDLDTDDSADDGCQDEPYVDEASIDAMLASEDDTLVTQLNSEGNNDRNKEDAETCPAPGGAPANALPKGYSLEGLNVDGKIPLDEIVGAIRRFRKEKCEDVDAPRLNILLSGAPGSGKTAFAHYLANEVGAKLMTLRASEMLGRFVGDTEKRIDKAFSDAKKRGAILFIDEADSVLINRRHAEHSWEVSQTNQLLQCMESFEGILIAATNFVENLDEAVMRRFTYKLKLSYLTDEGKQLFFARYFDTPLTEDEKRRLCRIDNLTPGDFRTTKESLYYLVDKQTNDARLQALEAESQSKGTPRSKIGF